MSSKRLIIPTPEETKAAWEEITGIMRTLAVNMPTSPPPSVPCPKCRSFTNIDDLVWVRHREEGICPACIESYCFKCADCGEYYPKDDYNTGTDDKKYCQDCFNESFFVCIDCSETYRNDDAHSVPDGSCCQSCFDEKYFTCGHCGMAHPWDSDHVSYNDETWCQRCADRYLVYCDHCETFFKREEMHTHRDGYYGCENCYESYCQDNPDTDEDVPPEGRANPIQGHDYKPDPIFFSTPKDKEENEESRGYIGFELEVEDVLPYGTKKRASEIYAETKFGESKTSLVYCKHDGSLNNGFEIVSHPMTRRFLFNERTGGKKILADMITNTRHKGLRSFNTTTCGLHFHLSRKLFDGTMHMFKFLRFFFDLDKQFIVAVSGRRDANAMASYANLGERDYSSPSKGLIEKSKRKFGDWNRYSAVNLSNENTVEVRIFKGTLNVDSFFRKAELCFAVVEFTRNVKRKFTVDDFFAWVNANYKEYPYTFGWLTSRGKLAAIKQDEETTCV